MHTVLKLALLKGVGAWTPALLFGSGDDGFYYEYRADTMFKDSAAASPVAVANDLVYRVNDLTTKGHNGLQVTAASRPSYQPARADGNFVATKVGFFNVPDGLGSVPGEGFTITGLAFDGTDFWAGNYGLADGSDVIFTPSLVRMSLAGAKLQEINVLTAFPTVQTIQGVAIDPTDGSLFFASLAEGYVRHITTAGADAGGSFALAGVNGLAYDSLRDRLWTSVGSAIQRRTKAGVSEFSRSLSGLVGDVDQLFHDPVRDILWISGDISGGITGVMVPYNIAANRFGSPRIIFSDITAIEGFVIVDDTVYVAQDAYFHSTGNLKNQVQIYTADLSAAIDAQPVEGALFNGVASSMTSAVNPAVAGTMSFAAWIEDVGASNQLIIGAAGASAANCYLGLNASGAICGGIGAQNLAVIAGSGGDMRRKLIVGMIRWDGSTVKLNAWDAATVGNGQRYSAAQSGTPTTSSAIAVGAYNNNGGYAAWTNAFSYASLNISRALSDDEAVRLAAYSLAKWA